MSTKRKQSPSWRLSIYLFVASIAVGASLGGAGLKASGGSLMRKESLEATLTDNTGVDVASEDEDISFFIRDVDHPNEHTLEGYVPVMQTLMKHPSRVLDEDKARFSFSASLDQLDNLPNRSMARPYLLWGYDRGPLNSLFETISESISHRGDVLAVGFDLRPAYNASDAVIPGVTFPPPRFFPATGMNAWSRAKCSTWGENHPEITAGCNRSSLFAQLSADTPRRFLVTFRGENNTQVGGARFVRPDLAKAFRPISQVVRKDILVQVREQGKPLDNEYGVSYEELLSNATFALVPSGHGRWSYRLSEAVGACAIPVIIADGMTLPFEELIDWSTVSIRLPEKIATDGAEALMSALPHDADVIRSMRRKVCEVSEKYFASMETRADALLRSAAVQSSRHAR